MNSIAQESRYRLSVLQYANRYGVTQAAREYHCNRQFIYRLRWRYDGTPQSLLPKSRRPHSHPRQHTEEEIDLIRRMRRRNPHDGLIVFWVKLRQRGYTRTPSAVYRCLRRLGLAPQKLPNPKRKSKPYERAVRPGSKVQIDVKVVPKACIAEQAWNQGLRLYQYTALDECTRFRDVAAFPEQSTYSSAQFLDQVVKHFPFRILEVQTDNGREFTERFMKQSSQQLTLFEEGLRQYGIAYHRIRPYTPRHNGKVERSHRKDNEYFYASHRFYSFEDFHQQLAVHNRKYNEFPMKPLGWKSPKEYLHSFFLPCVTND